jgi:hypothetical protein
MRENKIPPILLKLQKESEYKKRLGAGNESREVKSFKVANPSEQGAHHYAEKTISNDIEKTTNEGIATKTLEMYQKLKALGLPVVSFLKIGRRGSKYNYGNQFYIQMEDISESGHNLVVPIWPTPRDGNKAASNLLTRAENRKVIIEKMIKALAVLHNNDVYESHATLSFFLVVEDTKSSKNDKLKLDFKILDYSNFDDFSSKDSSGKVPYISHNLDRLYKSPKAVMASNLEYLELGVISIDHTKESSAVEKRKDIEELYKKYRLGGIKTFS